MMIPPVAQQQQDEVRSRDGVVCRSAPSSPTLDVGAVAGTTQQQNIFNAMPPQSTGSAYVRISIPLGKQDRVDCNRLYELEIERLKMELEAARRQGAAQVIVR